MVITVSCPDCETSFPADPAKIPEAGVKVRCSQCAHVFRVERPKEEVPSEVSPEPDPMPDATPEVETDEPGADGGDAAPAEGDQVAADRGDTEEWAVERDPFETADAEQPADEPAVGDALDGGAELPDWASSGGDELSLVDAPGEAEPPGEPEVPEPTVDEAPPEADPLPGWEAPSPEVDEPVAEGTVQEAAADEAAPEAESVLDEVFPEPEPLSEPELDAAPSAPADAPVKGFTFGKRDPMDKARRLARVLVSDMVMYNAERHQLALSRGTLTEDFEEEIDKSWKEYVDQLGSEIAEGEGQRFWTQALNDILAKGEEVF